MVPVEPPDPPPAAIDSGAVLAWARIDRSVEFTGALHLFVDGRRLGAVPALAIVHQPSSGELLILHCSADWQVLGVSAGQESLAATKSRVEAWYRGVAERWVDTGATAGEQTEAIVRESWSDMLCSFCGKAPADVASIVSGPRANICDQCVAMFAGWLAANHR